jgi:hypothetical protein
LDELDALRASRYPINLATASGQSPTNTLNRRYGCQKSDSPYACVRRFALSKAARTSARRVDDALFMDGASVRCRMQRGWSENCDRTRCDRSMPGQRLACVLGTAEQYSGSQLVREIELVLLAASFDSLVWWPWLTIRGCGYEHSA